MENQSGNAQDLVNGLMAAFEWKIKKASSFATKTKVIDELAKALVNHGLSQKERANLIGRERQKIA